jgi:cytoskeletal protein CcmA (bactofilin family)
LVREQLKVLSGGKITGSVKYSSLVVEEGGLIDGTIDHITDEAASDS